MPAPLAFSIAMMALAGSAAAAQPAPPRSVILEEAAADLLSRQFRACFIERDAPLNAESYACLDREYHRLEAVLTREYRAALARQPDDVGREHLQKNERAWWRTLFKHCKDEIGDMRGSTATVMNENCEIDASTLRIAWLQHFGRGVAPAIKLEDMPYDKARALILAHGWKPFPRGCGGPPVDGSTCRRFPELGYCQGTSPGYCGMTFAKVGRCLSLMTLEAPPDAKDDTWIVDATVAHGNCPKED